jgi:MFS family permease
MGWVKSLIFLALLSAVIVPLSVAMAGGNRRADDEHANQTFSDAILEARTHSGFILLTIGYFVCGFQTSFISAHLPAYLSDLGQPSWAGATALMLIGGFNVIGCIFWGKWGDVNSKKNLLALLYFLRSIVILAFILMPITSTSLIIFSSLLGLLWLGTVPLTAGVVVQIFGTQYMATLVGLTFVGHQIGAFLGVWLGGVVFDLTGNYDYIFWGGVVLGLIAAIIHFSLDDRPIPRFADTSTLPAQ